MDNIFLNLTGIVALVLMFLSIGRATTWMFEGFGWTIIQYVLAAESVYLFSLGLLWEVTA